MKILSVLFLKSTSRNKFNKKVNNFLRLVEILFYERLVLFMSFTEKWQQYKIKRAEKKRLKEENKAIKRERELVEIHTFHLR